MNVSDIKAIASAMEERALEGEEADAAEKEFDAAARQTLRTLTPKIWNDRAEALFREMTGKSLREA